MFNEVFARINMSVDMAAIFFQNNNHPSYFTYNFLANNAHDKCKFSPPKPSGDINSHSVFNDPLFVIQKGESLLAKIFEASQNNSTVINLNIEALRNPKQSSSSFKVFGRLQNSLNIKPQDLENENVLINFPLNLNNSVTESINQTFKPPKFPQNIIVAPVVFGEKSIAFITLGQYSIDAPFMQTEEFIAREIAQNLENFFFD